MSQLHQLNQLDPSIRENVKKMIEDAFAQYQCKIHVIQTQRTPQQAQTFHVLHMFLYNLFAPKFRPRNLDSDHKTIEWDYLKNPNVKWALIDDLKSQFLLTADGRPAQLTRSDFKKRVYGPTDDDGTVRWKWVVAPDLGASVQAMDTYLRRHRVNKQALPGLDRCGEPCLCGANASKHVSGKACDLSSLLELGNKIRASDPGKYATAKDAVKHFLLGYHLCLPVANEDWHVEALPPHVPKPKHPKNAPTKNHPAAHDQHCGVVGC